MFKILGNIYLDLYFLVFFGDCENFCQDIFQNLFIFDLFIFCFLLIHKTAELVPQKLPLLGGGWLQKAARPSLSNVFTPLSIDLQYNLSFE